MATVCVCPAGHISLVPESSDFRTFRCHCGFPDVAAAREILERIAEEIEKFDGAILTPEARRCARTAGGTP